MNRKFPFPVLLLLILTGLISYKFSFSFFSDNANSNTNVFAAASTFPTPTPSPTPTPPPIANHLVINEVLYDLSNDQQISGQGGAHRGAFVEINNPTGSIVNVNNWTITESGETETLGNINIPAGGVLIITGASEAEFETEWPGISSSVVYFQTTQGTIGNGFDNASGNLVLKNSSSTTIDQISWGGDVTILNPALPDVATGHSLERDPDGIDTDTNVDFVDRTSPTPGI
jgi:hypothetical protein